MSSDECVCSHARTAHEHLRKGTDCALCECAEFRSATGVRGFFAKLLKR